jgi:predicted nucleotidyltransferase
MKRISEICEKYNVALCYLFGSRQKEGAALLEGRQVEMADPEADIDFAVLFKALPENTLDTYALLSMDLQDIVAPFRADLLFLHEVDHLIQLEAIKGVAVYGSDEECREEYEQGVMKFAADEREFFRRNEQDMLEAIKDGYFEFEYKAH